MVIDGQTVDMAEYARPVSGKFADAWVIADPEQKVISVDVEKAKEVWKRKMREARAPKMQNLDVAYMRALEEGDADTQKKIIADKKKLRDVTDLPALKKAKTVEEIEAVWPDILN